MKTCPVCGMQSENEGRFCWSCGYDFSQQSDGQSRSLNGGAPQGSTSSGGGNDNNYQYNDPFTKSGPDRYGTDTGSMYGQAESGMYQNAGYGAGPDGSSAQDPYTSSYYGDETSYYMTDPVMVSPRNIVLCIVLTFVTCGIYGIYWMIKLNDEINILADEPHATSGGMVFLFTLITCGIYGLYWYYKMGERVDRIQGQNSSTAILYLVLGIFALGIINYILMQDVINKEVRVMPM
jgi:hypothetical protein